MDSDESEAATQSSVISPQPDCSEKLVQSKVPDEVTPEETPEIIAVDQEVVNLLETKEQSKSELKEL